MVTNNNFLAALLLRHWALAGHVWDRGCVRSWAVGPQGPHTHPLCLSAQRAPGSAGGSEPKEGWQRRPWVVATPSPQLFQVSGVMSEHWQCSQAVARGGGDSHGTSEGTKSCAKGSHGQGSAFEG